eukprot:GHVO01044635.1.p1 GENE.GHVO01044635.1~~GHVO01044635.1.p1  ORF type:complete len:390 (+),score=53.03 GHVO01044635.1:100-1269(+)
MMLLNRCDTDPNLQEFIQAGYKCAKTDVSSNYVILELDGLSLNMKEFLVAVLESFKHFDPREMDMQQGVREVRSKFFSANKAAHSQAIHNAMSAIDDYSLSQQEVVEVDTSPYRMRALYRDVIQVLFSMKGSGLTWWKKIYTTFFATKLRASVSMHVAGRFELQQIKDLQKTMEVAMPIQPGGYRGHGRQFSHIREVPPGVTTLRIKNPNPLDKSYGFAYVLQFPSENPDFNDRAHKLLSILYHELRTEFYRDVRTRQQLGYVVETDRMADGGIPGLYFNAQSEIANPQQLRKVTEEFLVKFDQYFLPQISAATLSARGKRVRWPAEDGPTPDEVKEFFIKFIHPEASGRRVLVSEVWPEGKLPPLRPAENAFENSKELKSRLKHTVRF